MTGERQGASMIEILADLRAQLDAGADELRLTVLDPDHGRGRYPGELVEFAGQVYIHRPWRIWVELGDRLELRLATPIRLDPPLCELRYERLGAVLSARAEPRERYGAASEFARIRKAEEPSFVLDLADALDRVGAAIEPKLARAVRILSLGVNAGDELALVLALRPELREQCELVGVDHSPSALAVARARFSGPQHRFVEADLNALASLDLGSAPGAGAGVAERFDLVLALDVLQSPGVDDRSLLRHLVQDRLDPDGGLILGLPNCRYRDGELVHGARMKNFRQPDLSLVIANIAFYRRYLHQHRRKVFVTGTHELLVTAAPG